MGKILQIYLKLNFTPNTLGSYGLNNMVVKKEKKEKKCDSIRGGKHTASKSVGIIFDK